MHKERDFGHLIGKEFSIRYRIVFADTDAAGIVHFSNYFRFFERVEEAFLHQQGLSYTDFVTKYKIRIPRVKATCEYYSPCRDGEEIEIVMSLKQLKEKSIEESFEIRNVTTGKISARGELVNAASTLDVSQSVPLPEEIVRLVKGS